MTTDQSSETTQQLEEVGRTEFATAEDLKKLREQDWYQQIAEDIQSDIVETEFGVRSEVISLYHRVGKRISDQTDNFNRAKLYGLHVAEVVGVDVKRHPRVIRRAMLFYKKFPHLEAFLAGKPKNYSWSKIVREELPEPKPELTPEEKAKQEEEKKMPPKPFIELTPDKKTKKWQLRMHPNEFINIDFSLIREDLKLVLEAE